MQVRRELQFDTDQDAGFGSCQWHGSLWSIGLTQVQTHLAYYKLRMKLSRELWDRLQIMNLATGDSYERLSRSFRSGFCTIGECSAPLAAKYIGGVLYTTRACWQ
jgi:hypothetical protein